ncbi:unnamed protein product [Ascophyllum nodosum]
MADSNKGSQDQYAPPYTGFVSNRRRAGIYVAPDSVEAKWAAEAARQGPKESVDQEAEAAAEALRKMSEWSINDPPENKDKPR